MTPSNSAPEHGSFAWCSWHNGYSDDARLVRMIEQGSGVGAGSNLFACTPCRETNGLAPVADQ
ncbi:hypothetical protein [Streptomyces sp. SID12488]|uniref:hypothetical protein n=1 Tax=Streptomyces sp. SID12488 TaxID=2706040 RepID=UPI0013DA2323|nr:hypothetical protein [Streptomyces sp. SID12488]NEA61378.1 hypothetical protein [Streptomyces sp. SID12488]